VARLADLAVVLWAAAVTLAWLLSQLGPYRRALQALWK
jgi:hypothetical protein